MFEFSGKIVEQSKTIEAPEIIEAQDFIEEINSFLLNYINRISSWQGNNLYNMIHDLGDIIKNIEVDGIEYWKLELEKNLSQYKEDFKSLKQSLELS